MSSKFHFLKFATLFVFIAIVGFYSLACATSFEEGTSSNELIGSICSQYWKITYFHIVLLMKWNQLSNIEFFLCIILTQAIQTYALYWIVLKLFNKKN